METTINIQNKEQIIKAWREINTQVSERVRAMSEKEWKLNPIGKWSKGGHMEHLFLSANPVSSALKLPKETLELRFGWFQGSPRSFNSLQYLYKEKLKVTPIPNNPFGPKEDKSQKELLESWKMVREKIPARLAFWTETELDRYSIPHPLMGAFSVREMLFFTIFHTQHHLDQM